MRVAALYDVHGNLPALEAVLAEVEREDVDLIVFGGDVAAGAFPAETVEILRTLGRPARFVRGNADREPEGWPAEQLSAEQLAFLAGFEPTVVVDDVLYCHATPASDMPVFTRRTPAERVRELLGDVEQPLVVCGHTHMQFDRRVGAIRVVNAGSVGMPYADRPGAYWALVGPDVEFRRTDYDLDAAAERIRTSAWPQADEFAAENVLAVPSEDEALSYFESLAS